MEAWEPERLLPTLPVNAVRFSRGFLQADLAAWFQPMKAHWLAFFHALEAEVELRSVRTGLDFPDSLDRVVAVEVDNEPAVIGLEAQAEQALLTLISEKSEAAANEILIDYLVRRLLSSVTRSWTGNVPLTCCISSGANTGEIEVSGVIEVELALRGQPVTIWLGIGPTLVERFDLLWREQLGEGAKSAPETRHTLSLVLAEFGVRPEMLVDYLKTGTIIALDRVVSDELSLYLDGAAWARAKLVQFNGRFAARVGESIATAGAARGEGVTKMQIELGRLELGAAGKLEQLQPGAVVLTKAGVGTTGALSISGEVVASVVIGELDGRFALNVLPR